MAYANLRVDREGGVAVLTIDRPKSLNALDSATLDELESAFTALDRDPSVGAIVVTGAGEKAFVAGADIRDMLAMGPVEARAHAERGQRVVGLLARTPKPVIAAINGYALGGGLELALACDIRLASENAVLGLPETSLAVIPGFGGTQRLARAVGPARAKELILTARKVPAAEAERIGLVNRVVSQGTLLEEAKRLAREILAQGPVAVRLAKEVVDRGIEVDLGTGLALEREAFALCFATSDQKEGMRAFVEKRKPAFTGR